MATINGSLWIAGKADLSADPSSTIGASLFIECSSDVDATLSQIRVGGGLIIQCSSNLSTSALNYLMGNLTIACSSSVPSVMPSVIRPSRYKGGLNFTVYDTTENPSAITNDSDVFAATVPSLNSAVKLRAWHVAASVATTNDGSNYWTVKLCETDSTVLDSLDTSGMSADTWETLNEDGISIELDPDTSGQEAILVKVEKTGSPGALSIAGPAAYVEI